MGNQQQKIPEHLQTEQKSYKLLTKNGLMPIPIYINGELYEHVTEITESLLQKYTSLDVSNIVTYMNGVAMIDVYINEGNEFKINPHHTYDSITIVDGYNVSNELKAKYILSNVEGAARYYTDYKEYSKNILYESKELCVCSFDKYVVIFRNNQPPMHIYGIFRQIHEQDQLAISNKHQFAGGNYGHVFAFSILLKDTRAIVLLSPHIQP